MGILNLEAQNIFLSSKWFFRLLNEEGIWQNLLKRKYMMNKSLSQFYKKPGDSQVWAGQMENKDLFLSKGIFKIQSENQVRFWEDVWIGNKTLRDMYPSLYNIARRKDETVANILSSTPLNIFFRRGLTGDKLN